THQLHGAAGGRSVARGKIRAYLVSGFREGTHHAKYGNVCGSARRSNRGRIRFRSSTLGRAPRCGPRRPGTTGLALRPAAACNPTVTPAAAPWRGGSPRPRGALEAARGSGALAPHT